VTDQAEHARIFGEVAKAFMRAAVDFTKDTRSTFSVTDVAKLYILAGAWLVAGAFDRTAAVTMLRELAAGLERGDDLAKPN